MLEKIPVGVGRALRQVRAGQEKLTCELADFRAAPCSIALKSLAFEDGGVLPAAFTADGDGLTASGLARDARGDPGPRPDR